MEDYEIKRAQAWDDTLADPAESETPFEWQDEQDDGFQQVTYTKKKRSKQPIRPVVQQRAQPRAPPRAPPHAQAPAVAVDTHPPRWPLHAPPRATPLRWRQHAPPTSTKRARVQQLPPKLLIDHADNEATISWRSRKPSTKTVRIPTVMVVADKAQNVTPTYERLALEAGAFAHSDDSPIDNASMTFGIWGEPAQATEAKDAILSWIAINEPNSKSAGSAKFPKVVSLTPKLRERANKKWERDIRKNRYRQDPPSNMPFEVIGSFHWPANEFRPEETFGMASEALDPIRMEQKCYITWDRASSKFQVYGKVDDVQAALLRIRKTFFHLCARQTSPVRAYVWWSSGDTPTHVFLTDYNPANGNVPKQSPRGEGQFEDDKLLKEAEMRAELNILRVRENISNALRNLHYLRGRLELRIHLGMFCLESYREPSGGMYELKDYENMLQASQFAARTSEELGGRYIEGRILELMRSWNDFCSPQDCMMENLSEIRPNYSAEFIFEDAKGDLRLSMTYNESGVDDSGKVQFTEAEKKWTRLHRDTSGNILDASLHDLATGSAWQFDLKFDMIEDPQRLPLTHRQFPERVRIKPSIAVMPLSNQRFFDWNPHIQPKSLRQVVRYQAMITGTDFTLEICQYQDRVFNPDGPDTVHPPRWSLNVFCVDWDVMFARNADLNIGTKADWEDDMQRWFPAGFSEEAKDEDGFETLLKKLKEIERRVRNAEAEEEQDMM